MANIKKYSGIEKEYKTMAQEFSVEERIIIGAALVATFQTIADDLEVANGRLTLDVAAECTLDAGYMVQYGKEVGMTAELYDRIVKFVDYDSATNFAKKVLKQYL